MLCEAPNCIKTCTINKEIYKLTVQNKLDTEMQLISKPKPD